jgi:5'-nucleotidase / UDP-sugar diphosphatase
MRLPVSLLAVCCLFSAAQVFSAERSFTILHTNDWQSRLLGFGPNNEYSPATTGDDDTVGGVARLATLLEQRRAAAGEQPVLLLDGGDFSMGTLFHTVTRETGGELRLMTELGYDAATLGNHEFDFRPAGLAAMISAAHRDKGAALMPLL